MVQPLNDPAVFGVLYLTNISAMGTNGMAHAKSIGRDKNVGRDRGNTSGDPEGSQMRNVGKPQPTHRPAD